MEHFAVYVPRNTHPFVGFVLSSHGSLQAAEEALAKHRREKLPAPPRIAVTLHRYAIDHKLAPGDILRDVD